MPEKFTNRTFEEMNFDDECIYIELAAMRGKKEKSRKGGMAIALAF